MAVPFILLGASSLYAQPKPGASDPRIEYLGGITICADDPQALAKWYTDKFGLSVANSYKGMYYGTLKFGSVELNIGIHPVSADCQKTPKGFAMTFFVDDYAGYLAKLAGNGLVPYKPEEKYPYGTFAYFLDPEDHEVAIWGK